ncbi:MAG: Flp pilus assembly protein CpaB [Myxococcota bacterium]
MARQQTGGRTKAILFLVGSLVIAGLTAALVLRMLERSRQELVEAQKPEETVQVVVAKRDLYIGLPITEEDIIVRDVAPDMIPMELTFELTTDLIRRVPKERILANEAVRAERLAQREAGIGLNAIIATGKRAMTVETDIESGLAGMLQPGNYVDIIVTIRPELDSGKAKWETKTILQGIRVLAVGSSLAGASRTNAEAEEQRKSGRRSRPSVTFEVTLEEAEKLALASSRGDIHIVLRNDIDITQQITNDGDTLTSADLIGADSTKAPPTRRGGSRTVGATSRATSKPKDTFTMEIIGDSSTQVRYDSQGNKTSDRR